MKLPTPSPDVLRARVLQVLLRGGTWSKARIDRALTAQAFAGFVGVTAPVTIKVAAAFMKPKFSPLEQALDALQAAGWIVSPRKGVYRITAEGRAMAKAHPDRIPDKLLPFVVKLTTGKLATGKLVTGKLADYVVKYPALKLRTRLPKRLGDDISLATGGLPDLGGGAGLAGLGTGGGLGGKLGKGLGGLGPGKKLKIDLFPARKIRLKPPGRPGAGSSIFLNVGSVKPAPAASRGPEPEAGPAKPSRGAALSPHLLEDPRSLPVWYGTNRKPRDILREQAGFGGEADTLMHYGYCMVNVPKGYVRGGSGRSWLGRFLAGESTELELGNINPLAEQAFWPAVGDTLRQQTDASSLLLFVHGYNVSFEGAAASAGQLSYELQLPAAFFSWASRKQLVGYTADEDQASEAVAELEAFIRQLAGQAAAAGKKLHVIAHSMGNRALLTVLAALAREAKPGGPRIAQVIFAAPDVSRKKFLEQLADIMKQPDLTEGRTLYVAKDKALKGSGLVHQNIRAGFKPPVTTGPGLVTVDVSKYNLSWLGHSYCFRLRAVMEDISTVMHGGFFRLRNAVESQGGRHWVLG